MSIYNEQFRRLETSVFKLDGGKWVKTADLAFLVRAHQNAKGERIIASQQIQDDKTFPFGAVYPLVYQDGKYIQGRPKLNPKRADWLYGFSYAQLDAAGEPASLYLTNVDSLRAQFDKGHWRSEESYGQSPTRVRWHDRLFEFHPSMLNLQRQGLRQAVHRAQPRHAWRPRHSLRPIQRRRASRQNLDRRGLRDRMEGRARRLVSRLRPRRARGGAQGSGRRHRGFDRQVGGLDLRP